MSTLAVQHLFKAYKSRQVVKDVSLSVSSGEVVGLLGPNGAGKTTSFYMIIGLVPQEGGSVFLEKEDLSGLPMDQRARRGLGYLPQEASVFRKLTVEENIAAVLETMPQMSAVRRQQRLEELLQEFHVSHIRKNLGMSLSGGGSRLPARWPQSRVSCCWTSPSRASTPFRSAISGGSSNTSARSASACSLPTTTCVKPSASATGPTS